MKRIPKIKDPAIAAILSFLISGLGQIYNGDITKGILIFIVQILQIVLGSVIYITYVTFFIVWIWAIYDAYGGAKKINQRIDEEEETNTIKVDKFIETLRKNYELFKHGILSEEEFNKRKHITISRLRTKKTDKIFEDFLYSIIPLKEEQILTDEDFKIIKETISFKDSKNM